MHRISVYVYGRPQKTNKETWETGDKHVCASVRPGKISTATCVGCLSRKKKIVRVLKYWSLQIWGFSWRMIQCIPFFPYNHPPFACARRCCDERPDWPAREYMIKTYPSIGSSGVLILLSYYPFHLIFVFESNQKVIKSSIHLIIPFYVFVADIF